MSIWSWDNIVPVVDPTAFVHEEATLIGDVIIGAGCYVGAGAVLRGDFGRITLCAGANFQETCVAHAFPAKDVFVDELGHIGHGAVLHGCHIGRNAMIGMNAVIMDDAIIGENSIIGALSFVKAAAQIPPNSMAFGSPAKVIRPLSPEEIDWKRRGTAVYQQLVVEAQGKLARAIPRTEVEPERRRVQAPDYATLVRERKAFNASGD